MQKGIICLKPLTDRFFKPIIVFFLLQIVNDDLILQDCRVISQDIFTVIFTVLAMTSEEKIRDECIGLLKELAELEELTDIEQLYQCHLRLVIKLVKDNSESWTIYSSEFLIFQACLIHTGPVAAQHLDLILPILKQTMSKEADPELRLKQFLLLSSYLMRRQETLRNAKNLSDFINTILEDIIVPSLVWSAGRVAEAIRTAAVCCLCAALDENPNYSEDGLDKTEPDNRDGLKIMKDNERKFSEIEVSDEKSQLEDEEMAEKMRSTIEENETRKQRLKLFPNSESFLKLFGKVMPILVGLVDDNAKKTRLYSLRAICQIMNIGEKLSCLSEEHVHQVYPVVLKRLDDGCDDVRFLAVKTLGIVWAAAPKNYDIVFSKSHVDALYTSTIVHLDDPDKKFQDIMLGNNLTII